MLVFTYTMIPKVQEKARAIELRKKGYSYRDIMQEVAAGKSSLSLWLRGMPLTESEKHMLKDRTNSNISRGRIRAATSNHLRRLARNEQLWKVAKEEFESKKGDPFFGLGVALYWAEGSKRSSCFGFTNSDHEMMGMMIDWIELFLKVPRTRIRARLYLHKPYAHENCEDYWARMTGISIQNFRKTIFKPTGLLVKKRPDYKGCLRIELDKTEYLRKMTFWQRMLVGQYGRRR